MKELFGVIREKREFKWGGFIMLETFSGLYQCVLKDHTLHDIQSESYVKLSGEFAQASVKNELAVKRKEFIIKEIQVITTPVKTPDVNIYEKNVQVEQNYGLDIRPYMLRSNTNKCIFKIQSTIHETFRHCLTDCGFTSISTPKIVSNGAEGGTNVFKLDYFGQEAYLAQSPQLYKQMMCGVFGKVFETGPVFRAERHNTSRHINEYLSLDVETIIENDFTELMELEKELLRYIFLMLRNNNGKELAYLGIKADDFFTNIQNTWTTSVKNAIQILGGDESKGDLTDEEEKKICEHARRHHDTDFVFVTHFGKNCRPFYTKESTDGKTTESFDLLYKGMEITSGGQRKEQYSEYETALSEAGINTKPFESYLEIFKYGMPLHGGFAIGLERLTAKICNMDSVKLATLFPRDVNRLNP